MNELRELKVGKARDEKAAAVLAAGERAADLNEERAMEFARRRQAVHRRQAGLHLILSPKP